MKQATTRSKLPRTARGRQTREKLLQAAEIEFGEKGFHEASISGITNRAGVALGSFYTYFQSKDEIFRALVRHMSHHVRAWIAERVAGAPDRIHAERLGLEAYLEFVRQHPALYRICGEAEFVANDVFKEHYEGFAHAYQVNLAAAAGRGEIRDGDLEIWSWALMGMMVFLGMRYGDWEQAPDPAQVADRAIALITEGMKKRS